MATSKRVNEMVTVGLPPLTRVATVVPGSLNEEERTVDVIWTTGAPVLRGYFDKYWEELSLDPKHVRMKRLNNGAPLLDAHDGYKAADVVGVVEPKSAALEPKRGIAKVRFAKAEDDPEADKIFRKVKDGILQNISVGYSTYKLEKQDRTGSDKIPIYLATDWEPYELSVVPMGADDGAGFRSMDTDRSRTPCVFVTRATATKEMKMPDDDEDETPTPKTTSESPAVAATRTARANAIADAKQRAADRQEAAEEARLAERERVAGIRALARRSKLGEEWASSLIEKGVSVSDAQRAAFDAVVEADEESGIDGTVRIGAGDDQRDKFVRGVSAWMFERTGTRKLLEEAAKKNPDGFKGVSFDGGEFRGYSPVELARMSLERQGVKTRGMDKMAMLGMAMTYRNGPFQTTSDFSTMLENVMGKVLLGAYETQETTYDQICGTDQLPDFRPSPRYRTGSVDSLDTVGEHGEYTNGKIPDAAKYAITTERKGKIFALSREALMNDDMGALTNLAQEFGRAAGRTIENAFYALLAQNGGLGPTMGDGQPYFHANRANVNATGSALTVTGLDADRVVMRAQKDPNQKDYLTISPKILLVPDSLYGTARVLNDSAKDPDANNKLERKNIVFGLFENIIGTPRLSAASTRRYLFANPAMAAAFIVAYLEGYGRGPILESQNGWRIDGVEWKVTLYAKVQPGDPKGALTNAGA